MKYEFNMLADMIDIILIKILNYLLDESHALLIHVRPQSWLDI